MSADDFPNQDIRISDRFLQEREPLLMVITGVLSAAAAASESANDFDVREALQGLIRTHRTLQSGLYYDSRPPNPIAANIYDTFQERLEDFRKKLAERELTHSVRDADVLGMLVFLERLELQHNNGRRKSRAFMHWLFQYFPPAPAASVLE